MCRKNRKKLDKRPGPPLARVKHYYKHLVKFLVLVGTEIAYCKTQFVCYNCDMTTNDLITLIRENHMNADCLAQIAMAVEAMREEVALDERECERCAQITFSGPFFELGK